MRTSVDVHNFLLERDVPHELVPVRGRLREPERMSAVLGLPPEQVARVVVYEATKGRVVVAPPAAGRPDLRRVAVATPSPSLVELDPDRVAELTDYLAEAVPPVGLPEGTKVILDRTLSEQEVLYVAGGEPSTLLKIRPPDLVETGETPQETAVREVLEETGHGGTIRGPLQEVSYWFVWEGTRIRKTVHFFLMDASDEPPGPRDREMEEVRWFPLEDAADVAGVGSGRKGVREAVQAVGGGGASPAAAQEEAAVRLVLVDQTPFATESDPFEVRVRAANGSSTRYEDLSLAVTVWSAARTRSDYAQVLDQGPLSPLGIKVFPIRGALGPGATRSFDAEWERLAFLVARNENALYPVTIELRSADARLAEIRSSLVYVIEPILAPLDVAACFVLDAPIRLRADGTLLDTELVEQILPGGRLDVIVGALGDTDAPTTIAVSPLLLEVLADMRDGFRVAAGPSAEERPADDPSAAAAGTLLDRIGEIARRTATTELVALPYASPSVPSIVEAGMDEDLEVQIGQGRQVVESLLGVAPSHTIFRPPSSALSEASLDELAEILSEDGTAEALLVDADVFRSPPQFPITPHGAAQVAGGSLTAVTPDPVVEGRTEAAAQDPALAGVWTLGELSAIYFERPSIPRGVAVVFGEGDRPPGRFLRVFLDGLEVRSGVRSLRGVKATRVAVGQPPPDDPTEPRELQEASRAPGFSPAMVAGLERGRADVTALASMANESPLLDQLRRGLLLAESRYLAGPEPHPPGLIGPGPAPRGPPR